MRPAFFSGIALAILLCSVQIVRAGDDAEKRKLEAQRLVERLGDLSDGERKRLIELKDEAFEPALKLVKELLPVCETIPGRHLVHRCRCKVTGRFERALSLLKGVAKKEHAPVMVSLLQEPNSCLLGLFVLDWYYDKFGEEQCIPLVLRILQNDQSLKHIKSCTEAFCLFVLNNSTDRRAVEFFHKQIKDKNAVPLYRNMAFTNLARTGGKKGLETVLASRDKQRTTSVVRHAGFEKMGRYVQKDPREEHLSSMDVKLVDTRKDAAGELWGLIASAALGSRNDLWIARWVGGRWSEPVFTGMTFETLAGSDWFSVFVGNAEIARDSDGDSLSDLVESRLGTNPGDADTDGDGLEDSIDKNPLAAPRKLNDLEQVLAAAFEGVFRYVGWDEVPAVVTLPEGVEPMEFMGWDRVVIVRRAEEKRPRGWVVPEDAVRVSFSIGIWESKLEEEGWKRQRLLVLWNKDRTEARLQVDADHRGSSTHLRKFGDEWVVTWCETARLSDMKVLYDMK